MMTSNLNLDALRATARGRWPQTLSTLGIDVPNHPKKHGPCPACGGKDRFRFDDEDGRGTWFCNQCDPKAGDGFDLVQNVRRCEFLSAAQLVREALGGACIAPNRPSTNGNKTMNGTTIERPVIVRTDPPDGELGKTLFCYEDAVGKAAFYVQRIEKPDGKKVFPQWGQSSDGGWQPNMDLVPKPKPLYRLSAILSEPDAPIVLHEGEKAAEHHLAAGLPGIPTTCSGGAGKAHLTDLSPLGGRDVIILPDNDVPGEQHAQDLARRVQSLGAASVKILRLPNLPPKGDIVEWIRDGGTTQVSGPCSTPPASAAKR